MCVDVIERQRDLKRDRERGRERERMWKGEDRRRKGDIPKIITPKYAAKLLYKIMLQNYYTKLWCEIITQNYHLGLNIANKIKYIYYSFSVKKLKKSKEKSLNIQSYINRIFTPENESKILRKSPKWRNKA